MRKKIFGKKLKRDKNERKALIKSLLSSFVLYDRIQTTEAKAKAIKSLADKLVGLAKKEQQVAQKLLSPYLNAVAIEKMIKETSSRFTTRAGGYTRIIKLGKRFNDNASMVLLEWTEKRSAPAITKTSKKTAGKKENKKEKESVKPAKKEVKKKRNQNAKNKKKEKK